MLLSWIVATLHLLALGVGLGAVWLRAVSLRRGARGMDLARVFAADSAWGLAALLWITTGLARAFAGLEKGTGFYLSQPAFHAKMGLLLFVLILEVWPMVTLIRWRVRWKRGEPIDVARAPALATISFVQAALIVLMVFAATALARGLWF
jgi:putative membrane protein